MEKDSQPGLVVRPIDKLAQLDPKIAREIKEPSLAAKAEKLLNIADIAISDPSNIQKAKARNTLQEEWKAMHCMDQIHVGTLMERRSELDKKRDLPFAEFKSDGDKFTSLEIRKKVGSKPGFLMIPEDDFRGVTITNPFVRCYPESFTLYE